MPKISFAFEGYCRTTVETATDVDGKTVNVESMSAEELCKKLEDGDLFISIGDHIYKSRKSEISITDFEPED